MSMKRLLGKVVVVTKMRRIPKCCAQCGYYDSMGNNPGRGNDGSCMAFSSYGPMSTRRIAVSKERLPDCPLEKVGD